MSEEFKPLFPRSPENEEEKRRLIEETQDKLRAEEFYFSNNRNVFCLNCGTRNRSDEKFCLSCGSVLDSKEMDMQVPVYGPAPMPFDEDFELSSMVYGPAPMPLDKNMIMPPVVYDPPPMPAINGNETKRKSVFIIIGAILLGLILFGAAALIGLFLLLR